MNLAKRIWLTALDWFMMILFFITAGILLCLAVILMPFVRGIEKLLERRRKTKHKHYFKI